MRDNNSYIYLSTMSTLVKLPRSYRKWSGMIQRCTNPKAHNWKDYGGRGITVCDRWHGRGGYKNFVADMGEPPEGLTLDRIDGNKGYSPDNCRWATWKEQAQHRRPVGPKPNPESLAQKAKAAGMKYSVAYQRIRNGWNVTDALSTPIAPLGKWVRNNKLQASSMTETASL